MAHFEEIDYVRRKLYVQKFENETEFLKTSMENEEQEEEIEWMTERIKHLEKILETLNKEKLEKPNIEAPKSMFDEIEKMAYKKPWNKLSNFHRVNKINEYLNEKVEDTKERSVLSKKFSEEIHKGRLGTKKYVTYDPEAEKILEMPCLKCDDISKKYSIEIELK